MVGPAPQLQERPSSTIDDSDVVLTDIKLGGKSYRATPPLHYVVEYDPSDRVCRLSGDFGIFFSEPDRTALLNSLHDVLEMFWTEIAEEANDDRLTPTAMELRDEMRLRLRRVSNRA